MIKLIKFVRKKINNLILSLSFSGVIMLILAVLVVWSEFLLRLIIGLTLCFVAFMFFASAYKVHEFKNGVENLLKIKK